MSLPTRKQLPHDPPSWAKPGSIFFITICCSPKGQNQLCQAETAHLFLLMPDHLHALLSFPCDRNMKSVISKWKEYTAKHVGIRWQRDFFDDRLRSNESFDEKAHYIRRNPVRENLVSEMTAWPYAWDPNR
jgi:putative transposase